MQENDNITDSFDLLIKEVMQDAEEKPSPRVWHGIASRIDAAAAPVAGAFRWGWAVLAAAAAVAAVLVIPNNSNLSTIQTEREILAQAATVQPAAIPSPKALGAMPIARCVAGPSENGVVMPGESAEAMSGQNSEVVPDQNGHQGAGKQAATEQAGAAGRSGNDSKQAGKDGRAQEQSAGQAMQEPDAFSAMAYEDSRKASRRQRPSLYIGGSMGGNEASQSGASYGAKGSNPAYIENVITEDSASNYGIPVSLGAGIRFPLGGNFYASVGADYSYLTRSFTGTYYSGEQDIKGEITHEMRYVGVPVGLYYNLIRGGKVRFYLLGVGEAEWCVGNSYNIRSTGVTRSEQVSGTQFSAGGGFGVDFAVSKHLSIYVDPAVRYYFDCGHPGSIRTEKQFMLNFNAGLRFNLEAVLK